MVIFHCYCWWKKSCTTWLVWNPANNRDIYYCLPYQLVQGLFHQQYGHVYRTLLPFQTAPQLAPRLSQTCDFRRGDVEDSNDLDVFAAFRWNEKGRKRVLFGLPGPKCHSSLGGGNSNIFYFHPEIWGNDWIWRLFFKMGWLKPPTRESVTASRMLFGMIFWSKASFPKTITSKIWMLWLGWRFFRGKLRDLRAGLRWPSSRQSLGDFDLSAPSLWPRNFQDISK